MPTIMEIFKNIIQKKANTRDVTMAKINVYVIITSTSETME